MKSGMGMMMGLIVALLIVLSPPLYAADVEVDKEEFDKEWKEAYESLPPEAREEFYKLTIDAFKEGEVGYATEEVPVDRGTAPTGERSRRGESSRDSDSRERGESSRDRGAQRVPGERGIGTPPPNRGQEGPYGPGGPDDFYGPRIGGQTYGAGRTDDSYGPRMEDRTLRGMGYSEDDISKIRRAEDEIGTQASKVEWDKLTREEAMAKELELQRQFQEMSGHNPIEVFGMGGPQPVDMPRPGEGPVIFTDRPLGFEPPGYKPPIGEVWDGEGPMPPAFDPYGRGPIGPESPHFGPSMEGPGAMWTVEGDFVGPKGFEGPYYGPPMGDEHYGPMGPEGPGMYGPGPFEGPAPMGGPYFEGPYMEGPGFEGPKFEGPYMEGPHFEGPMTEGPYFEGPMMEGPYFEGPMMEGPMFEGPMMEGPMFEPPEGFTPPEVYFEPPPIDDRPYEFEPEGYEPPKGEIYDDGQNP